MFQKDYNPNGQLDFQITDKFAVLGVSGKGKTTIMEGCSLKLKEQKKPFVFVAGKFDYCMHNHVEHKLRLSQTNLDFYSNVVSNSTPEAMFVGLDRNANSDQVHFDIEIIRNSLNNGAFLFLDEPESLSYDIPEFKQFLDELIERDDRGFAISIQRSMEYGLQDIQEILKKVDFFIEADFQPKQK